MRCLERADRSHKNCVVSDQHSRNRTFGKAYETDQCAIKAFLAWIPNDWLAREQSPDYAIDYVVEPTIEGEPSGRHFAAQLKGTAKSINRKNITFSAKTKHVRYWAEKTPHPVFLFFIEANTKEGWWIFVQKYIRDKNINLNMCRKSFTFHFSERDNLESFDRFKAALIAAEEFVKDLHPSSIQAALKKKRQEIEAKDPRFEISVTATESCHNIVLNPKPGQFVGFKIKTSRVDLLKSAFEHGKEIRLNSGEFTIVGSPIFEDLEGETRSFVFSPETKKATLQLTRSTPASRDCVIDSGIFRIGTKTFSAEFFEKDAAFRIEMAFEINRAAKEINCALSLMFNIDAWFGQEMLSLKNYESIRSAALCFLEEGSVETAVYVEGVRATRGEVPTCKNGFFDNFVHDLERIEMCRSVAKRLGVNPQMPRFSAISESQWDFVVEVFEVFYPERCRFIQRKWRFTGVASGFAPFPVDGCMKVKQKNVVGEFFGLKIDLGVVVKMFTHVKYTKGALLSDGNWEVFVDPADDCLCLVSFPKSESQD